MKSRRASVFCAVISLLMLIASATVGEADVPRVRRSDDVNFESLKTVVEQQAAAIQTLTAQVTSQKAEVTALKNNLQAQVTSHHDEVTSLKRSLHALQTKVNVASTAVAFTARLSGDQDSVNDGVALGHHQTLVFNLMVNNAGKAYGPDTGIFTAPVAGTYAFFLNAMSTNKHGPVSLAISKNGSNLGVAFAEGSADLYDQGSCLVSTQLVQGDRVSVRQNDGDAVRAGWYTVFSGYLLQAV